VRLTALTVSFMLIVGVLVGSSACPPTTSFIPC
jgi:hypothetical protein